VHGCLFIPSVVCWHVDIPETGHSLVPKSPTECDVSKCDVETPKMKTPRPFRAVETLKKYKPEVLPFEPICSAGKGIKPEV